MPGSGLEPPIRARARRRRWLALTVAVGAAHLIALDRLAESRLGFGAGDRPAPIEVTFVRELAQSAPPPPAPVRQREPRAAIPRAIPASAPEPEPSPEAFAELMTETAPAVAASEPAAPPAVDTPPAAAASDAQVAAAAAPAASAAASQAVPVAVAAASAPDFAWPPSTRLRFRLEGNYRGRIEGSATVDWLRSGDHYQVHLETSLGPVLSRRITSDGVLTAHGLAPRRFDGEQWVLFRGTRRWAQRFGPDRITLADGTEVDAPPGAQDEASQFVQLTWLFTTHPEALEVGKSLAMPLALNRRVDKWIYDVVGEEVLDLPFGPVRTFHLKPRREAGGGDLTPQIWIAPTLQYLPVRITLHQNAENYIDLQLDRPPLQAER